MRKSEFAAKKNRPPEGTRLKNAPLHAALAQPDSTPGDTAWFTHERFGLFIHWGLYSLGRHERAENCERNPEGKYCVYFEMFNPDLYDPRQWARAAREAGMRYFVITTKHHEGFCLWDSQYTDYKAPNTPYGRDLLKPMVEAFRAEGLRVGFYYSLLDWHHPDFPIDPAHPCCEDQAALARNSRRKMKRYAEYMRNQVRELLTNFGPIDILWLDFSYPTVKAKPPLRPGKGRKDWESEKLYALIRELQPRIILNDRLDLDHGWDIKTPEQFQPRKWIHVNGKPVVWEACQTFSGSWGYHRDEATWKNEHQLVTMLIDTVSKGGNLLMNVGPTARGEFDPRALRALAQYGEWMQRHERSIRGCTQAPKELIAPQDCRLTYNPKLNRAYLHILSWPFKRVHLPGWTGKIKYAQLLNDASEIRFNETAPNAQELMLGFSEPGSVVLELPVLKPPVTVPVVELFLK
ncbi:MAG: alpha-L-fucosidase [Verrucomicrobia bacterium]|nr:alpha-L-fucosidase [Verrucomicrobiota bacterium]